MSPQDAPAMIAAKRIGAKFHESNSDSIAMIVLESDKQLGEDAHRYYDGLVKKLQADPKHVQHVQNVWGDPLTAAGVQSRDGKAAYVQLNLAGDQGSTLGNESVEAVRTDRRQVRAARRAQGVRHRPGSADHGHERSRRQEHVQNDGRHGRGHHDHALHRLSFRQHGAAGSRHGRFRDGHGQRACRAARELRAAGLFDVRRRHAVLAGDRGGNRLRDLSHRSLPGGAAGRSRPRNGLLHHVPRDLPHHLGLRADDRGRHLLPAPGAAVVFQGAGHSVRAGVARRGRGSDDRGARPWSPWPPGSGCSTRDG